MNVHQLLLRVVVIMLGVALATPLTTARADLKEMKKYKEAFPEAKPKCIECHAEEKPKKEDGQHDLNDYGKVVKEKAGKDEITAETYKAVGKIEDFKK